MKNIWVWIVAIVVISAGGYWWWQSSVVVPAVPVAGSGAPAGQQATSTTTAAGSYTMAQVATHANIASCWSTIDGNVYDLTSWIPQHPGGKRAIEGLCGKDGTAAFHGQHGDAKKQADILATMKIGVLAQ